MGNVKGLGSRVELLASGTRTVVGTSMTLWSATTGGDVNAALPAWCHTVLFKFKVDAMSGAPANLKIALADADGFHWVYGTAMATPLAAYGGIGVFGQGGNASLVSVAASSAGASAQMVSSSVLPRNAQILLLMTAAAATQSISWTLYCIGG